MKKIIVVVLIVGFWVIHCLTIPAKGNEELYPRTMVVSEIDAGSDTVVLTDSVGFVWAFYGVEDWQIGDICSCIMDTSGTENIEDDAIIDAKYNGQIEDFTGGILK